jgi:phytoene dehydrogenase-like protein
MHDAIVLGSDPNALVCAGVLARAGKRVLVIEPRAQIGGTAALQEITKGFSLEVRPPEHDAIAPSVVSELALEQHGLVLERAWKHPSLVVPQADGPMLTLFADVERSRAAIAEHSKGDAEKWPAFCARMAKLAGFLGSLYDRAPPRPLGEGLGEMLPLAAAGLRLRRLGKTDMIELLRILPLSVRDLLDEWFESPVLKAGIAACGVDDLRQGPRSAGTGFVLLHHLVGRAPGAFRAHTLVRSEQGQLVSVLARAVGALGVELRTGTQARVQVKDGRACGVVLDGGDELPARAVISGHDARRTLLELVDPTELMPEVVHAVRHVKHRGVRAMLALALDGLPEFPVDALHGVVQIGATMDAIERAYDHVKYREMSRDPLLLVTVPSLDDASLAPAGKHVMSVAVQYVPYSRDDVGHKQLVERVIASLSQCFPGLSDRIVAHRLHTPRTLERDFGLTEGQLGGGELGLDQILFMRPIPGFAEYRTPIPALWLCGDATHPGGALPGMAGMNAARAILHAR